MNKDAVAEMSQQYQVEAAKKLVPKGYKQTEVGVTNSSGANLNATSDGPKGGGMDSRRIPEGWEMTAFGTLSKLISEKINPKVLGGGDFCIELEHIAQGKGLLLGETKTTEQSSLKSVFAKGDVLFGKLRAYLRKYWLADRSGVCSTEIWVLRAEKNKAIPSYIYQLVQTDSFIELASEAYGTHMPRSDWNIVKEFQIAVPQIHEQTAIANALSDTDALLSELEKLIAKKQAIKTATMQQLLTGRTRLPQFAHHPDGSKKGYKQSELGEIPEDWEVVDLGAVCKVQGGFAFKSEKFQKQGLPVVRISNIQSGVVDSDDVVFYPKKEEISKQFLIRNGDALIAMSGATTGKVGVYYGNDIAYLNQRVGKFVVISSSVYEQFIQHVVMSYLYRELLFSQLEQGAQPNVSSSQLEGILIRLPGLKDEQTAIATVLSDMDEEIQALEQRLNKTRQIKQGMMQELLTGKTRLVAPQVSK